MNAAIVQSQVHGTRLLPLVELVSAGFPNVGYGTAIPCRACLARAVFARLFTLHIPSAGFEQNQPNEEGFS